MDNIGIELLIVCIISFIIWAFVLSAIIRSSIKSGLQNLEHQIKTQNRLLIMMLHKDGVDVEEIEKIQNESWEEFKKRLK